MVRVGDGVELCAETYGDRAETGNGKGNSDDLAQTRALAERDDGERDREYRLKRCDHRRKPGRQPGVHRHEENPELPDTDEQTDGDNRPPEHPTLDLRRVSRRTGD